MRALAKDMIARALGILTEENVRHWLEVASTLSTAAVIAVVVALLFVDLFIAVPTLTIVILEGYFLGFELGFMAAMLGSALAPLVALQFAGAGVKARLRTLSGMWTSAAICAVRSRRMAPA